MAAEIINLNKARKARARVEAGQKAVENRIRFGRTKAEKLQETDRQRKVEALLSGARLVGPAPEKP